MPGDRIDLPREIAAMTGNFRAAAREVKRDLRQVERDIARAEKRGESIDPAMRNRAESLRAEQSSLLSAERDAKARRQAEAERQRTATRSVRALGDAQRIAGGRVGIYDLANVGRHLTRAGKSAGLKTAGGRALYSAGRVAGASTKIIPHLAIIAAGTAAITRTYSYLANTEGQQRANSATERNLESKMQLAKAAVGARASRQMSAIDRQAAIMGASAASRVQKSTSSKLATLHRRVYNISLFSRLTGRVSEDDFRAAEAGAVAEQAARETAINAQRLGVSGRMAMRNLRSRSDVIAAARREAYGDATLSMWERGKRWAATKIGTNGGYSSVLSETAERMQQEEVQRLGEFREAEIDRLRNPRRVIDAARAAQIRETERTLDAVNDRLYADAQQWSPY